MAWQQNWVTQQIIQLSDDLTSLIIQEHQFLYCILHWIFEKYDITVTHSTCYIQPLSFEQWQLWTMVLLHFSLSRHYVMLNLNNLCYSKPILSFGHWAPFETIHQIPPTFLFTYKGLLSPTTRVLEMPSHFAGLSWGRFDQVLLATTKNFENGRNCGGIQPV